MEASPPSHAAPAPPALHTTKDKIVFLAHRFAAATPSHRDLLQTAFWMLLPWVCFQVVLRFWLERRNRRNTYAYSGSGSPSSFSALQRTYEMHGAQAALRALPGWLWAGGQVETRWSHAAYELAHSGDPADVPPPLPRKDEDDESDGDESEDEPVNGNVAVPRAVTAVRLSWWAFQLETSHFNLSFANFVDRCADAAKAGTGGTRWLNFLRAYTSQMVVGSMLYMMMVLLLLHSWAGAIFWRWLLGPNPAPQGQPLEPQTQSLNATALPLAARDDPIAQGTPQGVQAELPEPVHFSLLIPGISLPVSHLPLLIGSLLLCQFIHEIFGHALAAATISQQILGSARAWLPRKAGIWMPIPGFFAGAFVSFPKAIRRMDLAKAVDDYRKAGGRIPVLVPQPEPTPAPGIEMQNRNAAPANAAAGEPTDGRGETIKKGMQLQAVRGVTVAAGIGANVMWLIIFTFSIGLMPNSSFFPDAGSPLGLVSGRDFLRGNTFPWNLAGLGRAAGWSDDPLSAFGVEGLQGGLRISSIASDSPLLESDDSTAAVEVGDIILAVDDWRFYEAPSEWSWDHDLWNGIDGTSADQRLRSWELSVNSETANAEGAGKGWCMNMTEWDAQPVDDCLHKTGPSETGGSVCFVETGDSKSTHKLDLAKVLEWRPGAPGNRCHMIQECNKPGESGAICVVPAPQERVVRLTLLDKAAVRSRKINLETDAPLRTLVYQAKREDLLLGLTVTPYTPRRLLRPTWASDAFLALLELELEYFVLVNMCLIAVNSLPLPGLDGDELLYLFASFLFVFCGGMDRDRRDGASEDAEAMEAQSSDTTSAQEKHKSINYIRRGLQAFLLAEFSIVLIDGLSHWLQ